MRIGFEIPGGDARPHPNRSVIDILAVRAAGRARGGNAEAREIPALFYRLARLSCLDGQSPPCIPRLTGGTVASRIWHRSVSDLGRLPRLESEGRGFAGRVIRIGGERVAAWVVPALKLADALHGNPAASLQFVQRSRTFRFALANDLASLSNAEICQPVFALAVLREHEGQQLHAIAGERPPCGQREPFGIDPCMSPVSELRGARHVIHPSVREGPGMGQGWNRPNG